MEENHTGGRIGRVVEAAVGIDQTEVAAVED